jgi:hypothetical protein
MVTGLDRRLTFRKFTILFSKNTALATIVAIQAILPYDRAPSSAKHMGLPLLIGQSKYVAFFDILDKVQGKIEGWHSKSLSQAGKTIMVKVVASDIPSYAMSSFLLLDGFCRTLDKAFKNFWWGFPKDKSRNLSLKSWRSLCLPKDQGGLGFRLMKDVNLSLISKLGWNLLTNHNSSWVSLYQNKYIKYGNLLSSPLSSGSWIWNGIKATVPIIAKGACFLPSKFSTLPIWTSPWIPTLPLFLPTPRLPYLPSSYPLAISDLLLPSTNSWNSTLLIFLFHPSTIIEIMKIVPSPFMIRFFGLPLPLKLSLLNQSIILSPLPSQSPHLLSSNLIGKLYGN